jgi:hypothetical protein
MIDSGVVYFKEIQRFNQIWVWILVLLTCGFFWYWFIIQILLGTPFGKEPVPNLVVIIFWLIFGIGIPFLFLSMKLVTEVRLDGLYIRFFPFHFSFKKFSFEKIKKFKVLIYHPFREYGGWGIRYGKQGKAYSVKGNRGVQIEFIDGKQILIGSQRPEEFVNALEIVMGKQKEI